FRTLEGSRAALAVTAAVVLLGAGTGRLPGSPEDGERKPARPWALEPLSRPVVPEVKCQDWVRTPIDAFILSRLEESGIEPSPEAPRHEILRRLTLDLTGLLPSPEDLAEFLADPTLDAFDRAAERLLASPRHGERWARHWLDLARYAESEGFKSDETRPNAWRYRDYVIQSLNGDKPYDRFVVEQIAGDEVWPRAAEASVATGFNRHYPDESNARDLLQRRQEILNDITDTVGQAFLGLTFGCARCHDHKYDPILQADYYRLQAFFANTRAADDIPLLPPAELEIRRRAFDSWDRETRAVREAMSAIEEPRRKAIASDNLAKFPPEVQAAISRPEPERTPVERILHHKALPYLNPDSTTVVSSLGESDKKRWEALNAELKRSPHPRPGDAPVGSGIVDAGRTAPRTYLLSGGAHNAPEREVEPGFPAAMDAAAPVIRPPTDVESTGRRAALAAWIVDPANPLTARVIVNRVWQHHFGRGISGTPSDLGAMGDRPTHPDLLDWLARDLMDNGWSLKRLHRLIVTSSTYRQSSGHRDEAARMDPRNHLLWRFRPRRLEGEVIRDISLQAAGLLSGVSGGPSVFPELPEGIDAAGKWSVSSKAEERNRRSVYVFVRRNLRYPLFEAFDMPDTHESCAQRNVTVTAPQALLLLNDRVTAEWGRGFARRVLRRAGADLIAQVEAAYRIAFSRSPDETERDLGLSFLERQRAILLQGGGDATEAALADFCHALLNSSELVHGS
ncbi:MAG TPA: DUF1549 and DUF1553 domain-containing protein, partial [Planctomycetota bacterium]|nr:DUF1549 and DUF1553 domain-containing protein [Planctomycetota bacterium]